MSTQWILLVSENSIFSNESIHYAIRLARRMDYSVSVLMLSGNMSDTDMAYNADQDIVNQTIELIQEEGIHAKGDVGYGDKASELVKHLALNPSLSTIVWGGSEDIDSEQTKRKTEHWFTKIKSSIQCPVVRPAAKNKSKKQAKRKQNRF